MTDYSSPELESLINDVLNPIHGQSDELLSRYLQLHAVVYYFEYAVGSVRSQEKGILDNEADGLIVGNAVSTYMHINSSLNLLESALGTIDKRNISSPALRRIKRTYAAWVAEIREIRNRVAAHPEEDDSKGDDKSRYIMSKRTNKSTDGRVTVRQIAIKDAVNRSSLLVLDPRKELATLRRYLSEIAIEARKEFEKFA